jgi:hypothetical protein
VRKGCLTKATVRNANAVSFISQDVSGDAHEIALADADPPKGLILSDVQHELMQRPHGKRPFGSP